MQLMKLGKQAPKIDSRTLMLADYITAALPAAPRAFSYADKVGASWGMMHNDTLGDCTCAAAGHMIMAWTSCSKGKASRPTDAAILKAYSAVSGYNPKTGANDNGAVELDVLNYWRKTGVGGHVIGAFAATTLNNIDHVKAAVYLFGGCYIGISLPISAQNQDVWDLPAGGATGDGAKGSWGGHAVCVVGYDEQGPSVITWGAVKKMTWAFWNTYCDESYAIISNDFLNNGKTPAGFDMAALQADLKAIKH